MNTKALILAAGRGSRMKALTENKPKCFTEIENKRLIEWQFEAIKKSGINDIIVLCGYLKNMFEGKYETLVNDRWNETNMVSTLMCGKSVLLENETIISYSDILYHEDHLKALINADGDICITYDKEWQALWELRFENPLDDAETFIEENGRLIEIGEKTEDISKIKGQYMGLLKIRPAGFEKINSLISRLGRDKTDKLDMTGLINLLLIENIKITAVPVHGKWCEVDSESDLELYKSVLETSYKDKKKWSHDWR